MIQAKPTYRTSLRWRIMLALGLIVTVTASLFAYGVLRMKEELEEVIFDDMVRDQLAVLLAQLDAGTYDSSRLFKDWAFHTGAAARQAHPVLQALPPGSHHRVRVDDRYYQVEAGLHAGERVYLTFDITDWEQQEDELFTLLALSIVVLLLAALLMGWLASRAILAPVRALTERLAGIQPRQRQVRIAQDFRGYEIGQIARAFDQYLARLDRFVERERSFTAAASHELRTPLSVMLGALDVLDTQQQTPTTVRAIARLRRACAEMQAFIEATLFLSREDATTIQEQPTTALAEIVGILLEDNRALMETRHIVATMNIGPDFRLTQPDSIAQIMVGNILRNAIEHTESGRIDIRLDGSVLSVQDSGKGIAPEHLPRVCEYSFTTKTDGNGLGLNLVRRICDRYGWHLGIDSKPGEGTRVTIDFSGP